jgi:hypothetical protein
MAHACNPSIEEAEVESHKSQTSLGYIVKPYLRGKKKARWGKTHTTCPHTF